MSGRAEPGNAYYRLNLNLDSARCLRGASNRGKRQKRPLPTMGTCEAPPGFEDWPVVAVKEGQFWEVRERRGSWPLPVRFGGVNCYLFKTAKAAAVAVHSMAVSLGFGVCKERPHKSKYQNVRFVDQRPL